MGMERVGSVLVALAGLIVVGCATQPLPPPVAEDPTAPSAQKAKMVGVHCKWNPPLPEDREDPCDPTNRGAMLDIVERTSMRTSDKTHQQSVCDCR